MKLRNRFLCIVILPLFASLFLFSAVSLWMLENSARERLQNEVQTITHAIRIPLSYALENDRSNAMQKSLSTTFEFQNIYGAYIFAPDGSHLTGIGMGKNAFGPDTIRRVAENYEEFGQHVSEGRLNFYAYLAPLTNQRGRVIGVLQVNRVESPLDSYINMITLVALFIFVAGISWVLFIVWWGFKHHIDNPLKNLHHTMRRVATGDRRQRASLLGATEFRELATVFNQMMESIDERDREVLDRQQKEIELERELRQSRKLAEIGILAAGVAHELGSPLTVIKGQARRLAPQVPPDQQFRVARIHSEVDRMTGIIRELINLGRQHQLNRRPTSLQALVTDACKLLEGLVAERATEVCLAPPLRDKDIEIHVDRERFQQALINLIKNAVQASPNERVTINGEIDTGGTARISVSDSGDGIGEIDHAQLFTPFYTTKPVGQGSGLGLSVTHRTLEDHGGRVEVSDGDHGGAVFTLVLPPSHEEDRDDVDDTTGRG